VNNHIVVLQSKCTGGEFSNLLPSKKTPGFFQAQGARKHPGFFKPTKEALISF
jgi:hypothetical protein